MPSKIENIEAYEISPTLCHRCNEPLSYWNRKGKYCSRTCSAKVGNIGKPRRKIFKSCLFCNNIVEKNPNIYCSPQCFRYYRAQACNGIQWRHSSNDTRLAQVVSVPIEAGIVHDRARLRKYIQSKRGYKCEMCERSEWMNHKLPLELDHIDGNPANNFPSNLRSLCGNCHSVTPFWKGKNKGNGRTTRGLAQSGKPLC